MLKMNKITVNNLSKSFGDTKILRNINLDVPNQRSLVIMGGSGSGKSVLIKCIIGLLIPDQGSQVIFEEKNIAFQPMHTRTSFLKKFSMLFQGNALFDSLTVWQNICFTLLNDRVINQKDAKMLAEEKLKMVGLKNDILSLYPAQISGGMQKRVALARAIVTNPEIICFDEPTAGLDPINAQIISELISHLTKELKNTAITITHDMICMEKIAENVAMLYSGEIILQGSKEKVFSSDNTYIRSFVKAASISH